MEKNEETFWFITPVIGSIVTMQDSNGSNLTTKTLTLTGMVSEGNISLNAISNAILVGLGLEEEEEN